MARQRRGKRHRDRTGRARRPCGRLVPWGLALLIGCSGGTRILTTPQEPGGGGGISNTPSALIGEWETTLFVTTSEDSQLWTTQWIFRNDDTCRFRQTVFSALSGQTTEKVRDCRWTESSSVARIVFDDSGFVLQVPFSFPGGDRDRMIFEGFEYRRIG